MNIEFEVSRLNQLADEYGDKFRKGKPFPHVVIDDFMPESMADLILQNFPGQDHPCFSPPMGSQRFQLRKLDMGSPETRRLTAMPLTIRKALQAFNSAPFLEFLEKLTGIRGLIPDPYFVGGGVHQILPKGRLAIHEDFNYHPLLKIYRRINVLFYLNKQWKPEYQGNLELWSKQSNRAARKVAPLFNRLVAFNIFEAPHGHPEALSCPSGMTRKSLALYYYSAEPQVADQKKTVWAQWKMPLPPKSFFEDILPSELEKKWHQVKDVAAVLQVDLSGDTGGIWTIDLTGTKPGIGSGSNPNAACCLYASPQVFWMLISGQVDMDEAIASGAARIEADASRLFAFFQGFNAMAKAT